MKVITVCDDTGRVHVIDYNLENMKACLNSLIQLGYINENINENALTEDYPIINANRLLNNIETTPEQIEDFISKQSITGRFKPLNIVEIQKNWQDKVLNF